VSKWEGKFVIGLTGNIGTGKSVVRRMLEHLGAYGIDADALANRAIVKGAPGYQPVVQLFGRWLIAPDGQIDRSKLARIVFSDPEALSALEHIVHPLVNKAIDYLVRRTAQRVVVIEAIKLIEADLHKSCDSLWVTYTPPDIQLARLVSKRKMSEADARRRMEAQPPQAEKVGVADVVIKNTGSFTQTWQLVSEAWDQVVPAEYGQREAASDPGIARPKFEVVRGRPGQAGQIADLINRLGAPETPLNADDVMAAFGEKAFLLLSTDAGCLGVMGWQVENLVARVVDLWIDPSLPVQEALQKLVEQMERASRQLQCEAALIFAPDAFVNFDETWRNLGYEPSAPEELPALAWREAARESFQANTRLYFKQLRQDRILRPI
jgi:dephospho-CoA kinase